MPALQNIIIVIPRGPGRVRRVLTALQHTVQAWIGVVQTSLILNFSTWSEQHQLGGWEAAADAFSAVSDHELVFLYPAEPRRGCVGLKHEGAYDLINMSTIDHPPVVDRLHEIWRVVGSEARAALVGEELGANEDQIDRLLRSGEIPVDLDLCEAAILGPPSAVPPLDGRNALVHGGRLLRKKPSASWNMRDT
jgi:hypothetical protein